MRIHRWHALVAVIAWTVVAAGLHLLGDHGNLPLPTSWAGADTWYETVGPVSATMSLIRGFAMALSAWLAAATAMQLAASLPAGNPLRRAADRISPRWLIDIGRGLASVSLSASVVLPAPPALPGAQGFAATIQQDDGQGDSSAAVQPAVDQPGVAVMRPLPEVGAELDAPPPEAAGPQTYTVEPGDSCWSVAEEMLTEALGAKPDDRQTAELWRRLIDLNRERFLTGDPDLLYPNQSLLLPPMS